MLYRAVCFLSLSAIVAMLASSAISAADRSKTGAQSLLGIDRLLMNAPVLLGGSSASNRSKTPCPKRYTTCVTITRNNGASLEWGYCFPSCNVIYWFTGVYVKTRFGPQGTDVVTSSMPQYSYGGRAEETINTERRTKSPTNKYVATVSACNENQGYCSQTWYVGITIAPS